LDKVHLLKASAEMGTISASGLMSYYVKVSSHNEDHPEEQNQNQEDHEHEEGK